MVFRTLSRIDEDGRECADCGDYLTWDNYGKQAHGTRGYRSACRSCRKQVAATYYVNNKAQVRQRNDAYQANHVEQLRAYRRQYRAENAARLSVIIAAWGQQYPEKRRAANARRRQRVRVAMTSADRALSADYRVAIKNDPCFYCGDTAENMHDDHFIPLAQGGTDHWHNLVRACQFCNLSKGAKDGASFISSVLSGSLAEHVE